jgi:hypothetical protein
MCAAPIDFTAERRLIEASDDPHEILDWVGEYHQHARDAARDEDAALERQIHDLIEFATDQVVELKRARMRPSPNVRAEADDGIRTSRPERVAAVQRTAPVDPVAQSARAPQADHAEVGRREVARLRAQEKAADEGAQAERDRADQEELRQFEERAAKATARRDAALAATARIEAEAKRAAAAAERSRVDDAKRRAAKVAEDSERAAAKAEAAAKQAATGASAGPWIAPAGPAANRPAHRPSAAPPTASVAELTPLGMLFQEQLATAAGVLPKPRSAATPRKADAPLAQPAFTQANPTATASKPTPAALPPLQPAPTDDLPSLTGADLTAFRNWLAVSQRALAVKLGVEQSTISKGEGRPTTVLPPQLRKALHQAMGEPRPDAGGAP